MSGAMHVEGDARTGTEHLTPGEIASADAGGHLLVDDDGIGSVPTWWIDRWRARVAEFRARDARAEDETRPVSVGGER